MEMKVMKRMKTNMKMSFLLCGLVLLFAASQATADLYVDSAPNAYGSPDYAPWWAAAKADIVAGTFQDMRSGQLGTPGELNMTPYDEIVYSTGDLGKRLHWVYWLSGETVADLTGNFEVRYIVDWDGVEYTYDWGLGDHAVATADNGWIQPGSWADYSGGVIGTFGEAWWAVDDDATPFDTIGSPYDEADQADIDALAAEILQHQTFARGEYRLRTDTGAWGDVQSLSVSIVPVPGAVLLGMLGLSVAGARLRKRA
jgi:hypothetical protein